MPGTYDVYASATVAGSMITLAHFPFRIEAPITLEVGGDAPLVAFTELVPDHPEHAASLDFGQIDAPGSVAVTESPVGPAPPPGFMTTVGGAPIVYHSITTQAEFTPPVRVCLSYAQAELTASNETDLRMLRFADSTADGVYDPGWHVMTELDEVEADIEANVLCASTNSLSIFALAQLDHAGQGDAEQDGVPGATVTSSNFGGAFNPAVEAPFVAPAGIDARQSCDVTALAQAWVDGSLPNHGVLLREPGPNKHSFRSSEHARSDAHPRLDVCYVTP
ncbi:MAG TPA: DNRLRE domain-containing protein [Sorangium sp.]|nr:DNRLRE domain-containing protein [Sorangium sp.]